MKNLLLNFISFISQQNHVILIAFGTHNIFNGETYEPVTVVFHGITSTI